VASEIEERYFERREIKAALDFARAGGIAVHRNFDNYAGTRSPRGMRMDRPFLHVIGLRPRLEQWGRGHGLRPEWIQPEKRRGVAHYDVFGEFAQRLIDRLQRREEVRRHFALFLARFESPLYGQLAQGIVADPTILDLAGRAPRGQPPANLLFGAVHYLLLKGLGHPLAAYYPSVNTSVLRGEPYPAFREFCAEHEGRILDLLATRRVQTNDVARSAVLLPGFSVVAARADRPLALVEIGASAGLNLLFDRYSYDYGNGNVCGDPESKVRIECSVRSELVPPLEMPRVAWRLGIDLKPVDIRDTDQALWLRALVWPDQPWRSELLLAAIRLAQANRSEIIQGDALEVLPRAAAIAPVDAALCIFSSYTVYQFSPEQQDRLAAVLEGIAATRDLYRLSFEWHPGEESYLELASFEGGRREDLRLASAHDHGRWLKWLDPARVLPGP